MLPLDGPTRYDKRITNGKVIPSRICLRMFNTSPIKNVFAPLEERLMVDPFHLGELCA